jgi:hypothetical protein
MKPTRPDHARIVPGPTESPVPVPPETATDREALRALAKDIVKYCPHLAQMLVAVRKCPPYIGLN